MWQDIYSTVVEYVATRGRVRPYTTSVQWSVIDTHMNRRQLTSLCLLLGFKAMF